GNLQVGFALVDDSHDGETMTLRVNGYDRVLTIEGNRAKAVGPGQGLNTLLLVDPPDCAEEKTGRGAPCVIGCMRRQPGLPAFAARDFRSQACLQVAHGKESAWLLVRDFHAG